MSETEKTLIPIEARITGEGYRGIPNFRISYWLRNQGEETVILTRLYYELYVKPAGDFLGSGEAFKRSTHEGDSTTELIYLFPQCEAVGVASIFELDERKIGIIDKSRAGRDVEFRIDVYGDARLCQLDKEGRETTSYKRLSAKVEVAVPGEEWEKWVSSWLTDQRILLVKKETLEKLNEALRKHNKEDYDQIIQELIVAQKKADAQKGAGEARTEGLAGA